MSKEDIMKHAQTEPCNVIEMVAAECQEDFNKWMVATSKYCDPCILNILDCNEPWVIPNIFRRFKRLATLKLIEMEELECLPPTLFSIKTLKVLHLECLYRIPKVSCRLTCLTSLEDLIIRYLPELEEFPTKLEGLKELKYFEITDCPNATIPKDFYHNPKLRTLKITNTVEADSSILKLLIPSLHDECTVEMTNKLQSEEVTYNELQKAINMCQNTIRITDPGVRVVQFTVEQIKFCLEQVEI